MKIPYLFSLNLRCVHIHHYVVPPLLQILPPRKLSTHLSQLPRDTNLSTFLLTSLFSPTALPNSRVRLCVSRVWTRLHVILKVFDLASNPRPRLSVVLLRPSSSLSSRIRFISSFLIGMMTSSLPNDLSLQTAREFQFLLSYTIQVFAHIHMPSPNTFSTVFIIRPERTQSSSFRQRTQ